MDPAKSDWERFIDQRLRDGSCDLYRESMRLMDRLLIDYVLRETGGDEARTAEILGISLDRLREKLGKPGHGSR